MQTSVFISPNALLVECIINPSGGTTQQKNPFGTQQQLQNRKIIGIEAVSDQDVTNSPISTSNPVIPPAVFNAAFLSLYTASVFNPETKKLERPEGLFYDQLPLCIMRRVNNMDISANRLTSGDKDLFRIRPTEISWTKSYVSVPATIIIPQTFSALFIIHYLDEGDPGTKYM